MHPAARAALDLLDRGAGRRRRRAAGGHRQHSTTHWHLDCNCSAHVPRLCRPCRGVWREWPCWAVAGAVVVQGPSGRWRSGRGPQAGVWRWMTTLSLPVSSCRGECKDASKSPVLLLHCKGGRVESSLSTCRAAAICYCFSSPWTAMTAAAAAPFYIPRASALAFSRSESVTTRLAGALRADTVFISKSNFCNLFVLLCFARLIILAGLHPHNVQLLLKLYGCGAVLLPPIRTHPTHPFIHLSQSKKERKKNRQKKIEERKMFES